MEFLEGSITDKQKVRISLTPDGAVDGPPTWEVQSGIATVVPEADGMSAYLVSEDLAADMEGADTVYLVTADVDVGVGVEPITLQITLHVGKPGATVLGASFGTPEPK